MAFARPPLEAGNVFHMVSLPDPGAARRSPCVEQSLRPAQRTGVPVLFMLDDMHAIERWMRQVGPLMQQGRRQHGEALVDHVIAIIEGRVEPDSEPPIPDLQSGKDRDGGA